MPTIENRGATFIAADSDYAKSLRRPPVRALDLTDVPDWVWSATSEQMLMFVLTGTIRS